MEANDRTPLDSFLPEGSWVMLNEDCEEEVEGSFPVAVPNPLLNGSDRSLFPNVNNGAEDLDDARSSESEWNANGDGEARFLRLTPALAMHDPDDYGTNSVVMMGANINSLTPALSLGLHSLNAINRNVYDNDSDHVHGPPELERASSGRGSRMLEAEHNLHRLYMPNNDRSFPMSSNSSLSSHDADNEIDLSAGLDYWNSMETEHLRMINFGHATTYKGFNRTELYGERGENPFNFINFKSDLPQLHEQERIEIEEDSELSDASDLANFNLMAFLTRSQTSGKYKKELQRRRVGYSKSNRTKKTRNRFKRKICVNDDLRFPLSDRTLKQGWFVEQCKRLLQLAQDHVIPVFVSHLFAIVLGFYIGKSQVQNSKK